jgi:hypothetical protein
MLVGGCRATGSEAVADDAFEYSELICPRNSEITSSASVKSPTLLEPIDDDLVDVVVTAVVEQAVAIPDIDDADGVEPPWTGAQSLLCLLLLLLLLLLFPERGRQSDVP